jgi:hypothetical protein
MRMIPMSKTPSFGTKKMRTFLENTEQEKVDNKSRSVRHENRVGKMLGAKPTPNSGALPWITTKGDLQDERFMWQAKLTDKASLSLGPSVIGELCKQAAAVSKFPALVLTLEAMPEPLPKDWVAVPADIFAEILSHYK